MDKAANRRAAKALVGTTIKRRYQVVRLLGDGGMGAVYKAADTVLRRFVAIKMLHPSTSDSPSAVERFVREARSSAAIGHPNIIDVLDFGYDGRRPYLVMEYLRGRSLSEAIAEEGRLSVARACNIATHSLAGLSAAHDRGILHRDLKPANMMLIALLGDRDFVKLCDFGFAALVQPSVRIDGGKTLTPARTLVGTPAYAAPERLKGDDRRDPRLDVWSTGVVLFETLAGRRPFDAPTFRELARKIRKDPTPSLRSMRSDIPRGLDAVVQKALSKKRSGRFSTAAEFAAALVPFGGRVVPDFADAASDSFTMDLLRLRARETQQRHAVELDTDEQAEEARDIEALRQRFRAERKRREPADETSVERPSAARPYLGSAERQPQRPAPPALGQREPRRSRRRMAGVPADDGRETHRPEPRADPRRDEPRPDKPGREARRAEARAPEARRVEARVPKAREARRPEARREGRRTEGRPRRAPAPAEPQRTEPARWDDEAHAFIEARRPYASERTVAEVAPPVRPLPRAADFPVHGGPIDDATRLGTAFDGTFGRIKSVVGALPLAVLRFVSRRFGERALHELLRSLPEQSASVFVEGISGRTWLQYDHLISLVSHVDAMLGRDDLHLVVQCGRAAAESAFDRMRSVRPPSPPPQELMRAMPDVMTSFFRGMAARVTRLGRGFARLELDEVGEVSLVGSVFLIGFFDRSLDRFGAKDVEVNLASTPALGDEGCVYDISWLA